MRFLKSVLGTTVKAIWALVFRLPAALWREYWFGGAGGFTDEEIASADLKQQRRMADSDASPTDRNLARALIRVSELPPGVSENWRAWTPLKASDPVLVSVQQSFSERGGRLRRQTRSQLLLELSRYWSDDAATQGISNAPTRSLPGGERMRERTLAGDDEMRIYKWSRLVDGQTAESILELRMQRGSATAVLLAQSIAPTPDWERRTIALMRSVGERLR